MTVDLGEELEIIARSGRKASPVPCVVVREITAEDMEAALNPSTLSSTGTSLKTLRTRHHTLARTLSLPGANQNEVALATGFSVSRISILLRDPAFQELMAYYQGQAAQAYLDVHGKLAALGEDVVEELQERLEADPGKLTTNELLRIGEFALDRSVAPPKTKASDGGRALPQIKISFHHGEEASPQLTIEAPVEDPDSFL